MPKVIYGAVNKDIVKQRQACHFMGLLPPILLLLTARANPPEHIIGNDMHNECVYLSLASVSQGDKIESLRGTKFSPFSTFPKTFSSIHTHVFKPTVM